MVASKKANLKIVGNEPQEDKREIIRSDLLRQLADKSITGRHFEDLIEDYMSLWDIKNQLIDDVQLRGVSIFWENGPSQSGYKKNDSVSELTKTNAQMLKILNELGLKPVPVERADPDDEL